MVHIFLFVFSVFRHLYPELLSFQQRNIRRNVFSFGCRERFMALCNLWKTRGPTVSRLILIVISYPKTWQENAKV